MEKIEEKLKLLEGDSFWTTNESEELGIQKIRMSDGPHGVRRVKDDSLAVNKRQTYIATCFPTSSSLAQTFNDDLVKEVGNAICKECINLDVDVLLGPGLNIKRSPLCGRNFEYFSEDPFLSGSLASSYVKGVQENGVGACIKHFVCNNQETGRLINNSIVDERTLHEIYLRGFEKVVKEAKPYAVMASYNKLNCTYTTENKQLLKDILRDKWGFDGVTMSDWGAVNNRVNSLKAGLDLQMPASKGFFNDEIIKALESKELDIQDIDKAVENIRNLATKVGKRSKDKVDVSLNKEIALKAAIESIVLLRNVDNFLPLNKEEKVLVVGELFDNVRYQGGGSSDVVCDEVISPKKAFESHGVNFDYVDCYQLFKPHTNKIQLGEVKKLVKKYDKVILFIGLSNSNEMEGADRESLSFPSSQLDVAEELTFANPNTLVVVQSGSPVAMPFIDDTKAIIQMGLCGQMGGEAIYKVIYGEESPSGRLAETYPLTERSMPCFYSFANDVNQTPYEEGIFVGYRYYSSKGEKVLFPFGYGLSYSNFEYSDLRLEHLGGYNYDVHVKVKNIGQMKAKEVVLLFIGKKESKAYRPIHELKGFAKVELDVNEEKEVVIKLTKESFEIYDVNTHDFVVEEGVYSINISKNANSVICNKACQLEGVTLEGSKDKVPSFYSLDGFSSNELQNLLDFKIPSSLNDNKSPVSLDSTLKQIEAKSYFGKKIIEGIKANAFKNVPKDDLGARTILNSLDNQTLKSVAVSSGGMFTKEFAEKIIEIVNMEFLDAVKEFKKLRDSGLM